MLENSLIPRPHPPPSFHRCCLSPVPSSHVPPSEKRSGEQSGKDQGDCEIINYVARASTTVKFLSLLIITLFERVWHKNFYILLTLSQEGVLAQEV